MDNTVQGFLERNLPKFKDDIIVSFERREKDYYVITAENGRLYVKASNYVTAFHGIYEYLKKYCNVQLSWCANTEINIDRFVMFDGEFSKIIEQKYRVYMNYCTLDYSMCWWDFVYFVSILFLLFSNRLPFPFSLIFCKRLVLDLSPT